MRAEAQQIARDIGAIVDDGDVDHLVALLGLELGERVGLVAGDDLDLDACFFSNSGNIFLRRWLLADAAVTGDGQLSSAAPAPASSADASTTRPVRSRR